MRLEDLQKAESSHSLTLVRSFARRSRWLAKDTHAVNEVMAELDASDFEDSEDDFDGYFDMKSNDEAYTNKRRDRAVEGDEERTEKEDVFIVTNIEIESY